MSDNESFRSASPSRDILHRAANTDEVLNDHRNQLQSLPIRGAGNSVANSSAVTDDEEDSTYQSNQQANQRPHQQARQQPRLPYQQVHNSEPSKHSTTSDDQPPARPSPTYAHEGDYPGPQRNTNHTYMNNLRKEFYLRDEEGEYGNEGEQMYIPSPQSNQLQSSMSYVRGPGGSLAAAARRGRSRSRSQSFSEQVRSLVHPKDYDEWDKKQQTGGATFSGILMKPNNPPPRKSNRSASVINDNLENDLASPMTKTKTNGSINSDGNKRDRRPSRTSIESEADSHASRSSQETEEDVCFPMLREHVRIKGIDFDEIEEFIKEERENEQVVKEQQQLIAERTAMRVNTNTNNGRTTGTSSNKTGNYPSANALKYTPSNFMRRTSTAVKNLTRSGSSSNDMNSIEGIHIAEKMQSDSSTVTEDNESRGYPHGKYSEKSEIGVEANPENVKFGGTRINDSDSILPDRFSFFSSESEETIHAPDIPSLVTPGQSVGELFRNGEGTWWLDCVCPTDSEMKMLAKAFGIHPLTAEDIRMQETREKVELFRSYYFVCFHTFEGDQESEEYLEPINFYIVVFRDGVLSFHFSPILHPANVRRRVRQLRDYVDVSADWLCYALIDDITDGFAPVITGIEYEADAIEDSVFVAREMDFSNMIQRIGESRRKVMTLMRLLSGKADVIKMFAKRCQDEAANYQINSLQSNPNLAGFSGGVATPNNSQAYFNQGNNGVSFGPTPGFQNNMANPNMMPTRPGRTQPRADIALYLGDIQDHVITMFQNLLAYEKIFSRSHANYLAQLQVESFNANHKVTEILSNVTMIGTIFFPLNVITGLFGMNVNVPGQGDSHPGLYWFFGILGVMCAIIICSMLIGKIWLRKVHKSTPHGGPASSRRSIKSLGLRSKTKEAAKSIISFPNKYD